MASHDRQIWSGMLTHVKRQAPAVCRQWFEEIEPVGIAGGVLRLRAHSLIHRNYLRQQCTEPFNDAARAVSNMLLSVQFLGPDEEATPAQQPAPIAASAPASPAKIANGASSKSSPPPIQASRSVEALSDTPDGIIETKPPQGGAISEPAPQARPAPTRAAVTPAPLPLSLSPDYAFESFVVGPSNRLAHAAAMAVSSNPGRAYNPYFVHGPVGLGKTHLLQAVCLRILQTNPGARIYYTSCEGFITQFMEAVQAGEMSGFRHTFRDVDVLVIDDVHFLAKRDRTQEEFFHTFNSLYQSHKQIILSSDAAPEDIPELEDRLVSRFKWGLVSEIEPPCYETRVAILKAKAKLRGLDLPEPVACHIAARIDSNIRELEGAIVKIHVLASVEKRDIDLDMAIAALGPEAGSAKTDRQVQIQSIIEVVTQYFGVKLTDLQSKRRHRSIAIPRQVCMHMCRRHTRFSLEEIGGYFGGRDHTTVMHAVKQVDNRIESEPDFARMMRLLDEQLRIPTVS